MSDSAPADVLALTWRCQRQWSVAAAAAKQRLDRWRKGNLALLVFGALAGAGAAQARPIPPLAAVLAVAAALALAAAGLIQTNGLNADQTARWIRARAASEALKAEVFRYLAGVTPYAASDRDAVLAAQLAVVQDRAHANLLDQQRVPPASDPLPPVSTVVGYIQERAQNQADWHRRKSGTHARSARNLRLGQLVVTGVGAGLATFSAFVPMESVAPWAAATTTVAAVIGAQLAATQHQRVAEAYASCTDQLDRLIACFAPAAASPEQQARFVADVERVLAAQNEGWIDILSMAPLAQHGDPVAGASTVPRSGAPPHA